jgi:hypothetical protein
MAPTYRTVSGALRPARDRITSGAQQVAQFKWLIQYRHGAQSTCFRVRFFISIGGNQNDGGDPGDSAQTGEDAQTIDARHTYVGDDQIELLGPGGSFQAVQLMDEFQAMRARGHLVSCVVKSFAESRAEVIVVFGKKDA